MKKVLLVLGLTLILLSAKSQKQDSLKLNDSIPIISIRDLNEVLGFVSDKLSKKDWETWKVAYESVLMFIDEKKKSPPKKN